MARNLEAVEARIRAACLRSGRDAQEIRLLWVSKTHSQERIIEAVELGARRFGENKVQEAVAKFPLPRSEKVELHLIGHLQRNKVRKVLPLCHAIHSVDSPALLETLERVAGEIGHHVDVFLQVNTSREHAKSGFEPEALLGFLRVLPVMRFTRLVGLMTMGPADENPVITRHCFRELAGLLAQGKEALASDGREGDFRFLSMGMSSDFEIAIEEGAHFIRVGSGLFGSRS